MLTLFDSALLITICFLGAATPGISLALITRHTVMGGLRAGMAASISHAIGVGVWALATVTGLALLFKRYPELNTAFHVIGAAFLIWMAWRSWQHSTQPLSESINNEPAQSDKPAEPLSATVGVSDTANKPDHSVAVQSPSKSPITQAIHDGLLIALLNPKVALFYLAIFSQFLSDSLSVIGSAQMVFIAAIVDGGWYALVVMLITRNQNLIDWLKAHHHWLDRLTAGLMLVIAASLLY